MAPALFLMGAGPLARWRRAELPDLARRLRWAFLISLISAVALPLTVSGFRPLTSVGLMFGLWIASSAVVQILEALRGAGGRLQLRRLSLLPASVWGMHIAHIGIAAFVVGVTLVKSYESEVEARMQTGQTIQLGQYSLRFDSLIDHAGPNYDAVRGNFALLQGGQIVEKAES